MQASTLRRRGRLALCLAGAMSVAWATSAAPGIHAGISITAPVVAIDPMADELSPSVPTWDAMELDVAHPALVAVEALNDVQVQLRNVQSTFGFSNTLNLGGSGPRALIVRTSDGERAGLDDLIADLAVMARVVEKTVDPRGEWGLRNSVERLYIEDHGVVLLLAVPFPLASGGEEDGARERVTDQLWRDTVGEIWGSDDNSRPRKAYDEDAVENLTEQIVDVLQYGRNIRSVRPHETLTVIVTEDDLHHGDDFTLAGAYLATQTRDGTRQTSRLVVSVPFSVIGAPDGGSGTHKALVTTRVVTGNTGEMTRDLDVLSRVVSKAFSRRFGDESAPYASSYGWSGGSRGGARARYIDGFGVVVAAQVDFPLVGEPDVGHDDEGSVSEPSLWEDTRREMAGGIATPPSQGVAWGSRSGNTRYDAAQVEKLHEALIDTLKAAANMDGLGDDDAVAIVVRGPAAPDAVVRSITEARAPGQNHVYSVAQRAIGGGGSTLLTAHATKADIDQVASGAINHEVFRNRVTFSVAVGGGPNIRGGVGPVGVFRSTGSDPTLPNPNALAPPR